MNKLKVFKKTDKELDGISDTDWARFAAFIEGEGCIMASAHPVHKKSVTFRVNITNTEERLITWIFETFGGYRNFRKARNERERPQYEWNVLADYAAKLLEKCRPYCVFKQEQIDVFLALRKLISPRGHQRGCVPISTEEVEQRYALIADLKSLRGHKVTTSEQIQ